MCGLSVCKRDRRRFRQMVTIQLLRGSTVRGSEKPLGGISSVRGAETGSIVQKFPTLLSGIPSPPCVLGLSSLGRSLL